MCIMGLGHTVKAVRTGREASIHSPQHADTGTEVSHPPASQVKASTAPFHDLTNSGKGNELLSSSQLPTLSPHAPPSTPDLLGVEWVPKHPAKLETLHKCFSLFSEKAPTHCP